MTKINEITCEDVRHTINDTQAIVTLRDSVVAVISVFFADWLLFPSNGGAGYSVFFIIGAILLTLANRPDSKKKIILPAALLIIAALNSLWQYDPFTPFIGFAVLFTYALSLFGNEFIIPDILYSAFLSILGAPRQAIRLLAELFILPKRIKYKKINWPALLIPVVLCATFALIFTSANAAIAQWLESFKDIVMLFFTNISRYLPSPLRFGFWIAIWAGAAMYLGPCLPKTIFSCLSRNSNTDEEAKPISSTNTQIARNTLISVNLVFLIYNFIELKIMLFKGTLPKGISYSDYAHSGVFWLTVALALTSLILGIIFSRQDYPPTSLKLMKILSRVWIIQNFALGVIAYHRLYIYFGYNGLTRMRILGTLGIALVLAGLVLVWLMINYKRSLIWLVRQQFLALALTGFIFYICPKDYLVSKVNTHIILNAKTEKDLAPAVILAFHEISAQGLPPLFALLDYDNPNIDEHNQKMIREGIAGILSRGYAKITRRSENNKSWRNFDISSEIALDALRRSGEKFPLSSDKESQAINDFKLYTNPWY